MRSHPVRAAVATTAAATLTLGLLSAPPVWADTDPHSPADRIVPVPETWEPGPAVKDPVGEDPPDEAWEPPVDEEADQAADILAAECDSNPNGGIQEWLPLERHQISDRLELAVNTQNGNLVVQHRNLTTAGTGLDLSLSTFYNSLGGWGGWTLSHGQDVGLQIYSNAVVLRGPSGFCAGFDIDGDGSFVSPAGLNADLVELDNGHYALTFHRGVYEDQVWTFNAQGWLYSQADRNGNTHRLRYDDLGDMVSIVDSQDRVSTVEWTEQEGWITQITDPTGETAAAFDYNEYGDLVTLTDRAGQDLTFGWNDSGTELTSITDATGATWSIAYNSDGQVSSLTVPDGSEGGASTSYSYDAGPGSNTETVVSDPGGGESTFTFDDRGRQTSATDQVGNARSQTWTANSDVASTTDPLEASVTYSFDEFNNLIGTELPTGAATSVGFADTANPAKATSVTTPDGDELSMSYDDAGNLTRAVQEEMDIEVSSIPTADGAWSRRSPTLTATRPRSPMTAPGT
ncbi:hypothetical protein ABZ635_08835 [Nocardiopsis sp. NPDC007018]|uniref:hypothetical protein n=1 Tax=Nocardiopsis sp. NPDC007018 TaxID=3155721 RepID=UPI0033E79F22